MKWIREVKERERERERERESEFNQTRSDNIKYFVDKSSQKETKKFCLCCYQIVRDAYKYYKLLWFCVYINK